MAGTAITNFTTEVSYYIKGAEKTENKTFIDAQILKAVRDFTKETWIWREELTKIDVVDETDEYTLSPGTDNCDVPNVFMIDWVKFKEDGLDDDQFAFLYPWNILTEEVVGTTGINAGFVNTEADGPQVFYFNPDDTLVLKPIPNENAAGTANLQVKCILLPGLTATTAPTFLYDDWIELIAKGAASMIMNMAGKKWYNPQLSKKYENEYVKARGDEARAQRWGGRTRTQLHVRHNKGFAGGSRSGNNGWF